MGGLVDGGAAVELGGVARRREHEAWVHVLVVAHHDARAAAPVGDDVEVVAVVAELARLGLGRLVLEVEGRNAREERVAPADDRLPRVALGHVEVVDDLRHRRDGVERQAALAERCACGRRGRRAARRRGREFDADGACSTQPEQRPPRQRGGGDLAEGGVRRRIALGTEAGVPALQLARHRGALAAHVVGHGKQTQWSLVGNRHFGRPHGRRKRGRLERRAVRRHGGTVSVTVACPHGEAWVGRPLGADRRSVLPGARGCKGATAEAQVVTLDR